MSQLETKVHLHGLFRKMLRETSAPLLRENNEEWQERTRSIRELGQQIADSIRDLLSDADLTQLHAHINTYEKVAINQASQWMVANKLQPEWLGVASLRFDAIQRLQWVTMLEQHRRWE